jgi:hypothetical protein
MRRALLATALLAAALVLTAQASAAPLAASGLGCEQNTLRSSFYVCDASGDVAASFTGSALYVTIEEGWLAIRLDSAPLRPRRGLPNLRPRASTLQTFADGEYRVYRGPLFTRLPRGRWIIRLSGTGLNVAATGAGKIGLLGEAGEFSIDGKPNELLPDAWEVFGFGVKVPVKLRADTPKSRQ